MNCEISLSKTQWKIEIEAASPSIILFCIYNFGIYFCIDLTLYFWEFLTKLVFFLLQNLSIYAELVWCSAISKTGMTQSFRKVLFQKQRAYLTQFYLRNFSKLIQCKYILLFSIHVMENSCLFIRLPSGKRKREETPMWFWSILIEVWLK